MKKLNSCQRKKVKLRKLGRMTVMVEDPVVQGASYEWIFQFYLILLSLGAAGLLLFCLIF